MLHPKQHQAFWLWNPEKTICSAPVEGRGWKAWALSCLHLAHMGDQAGGQKEGKPRPLLLLLLLPPFLSLLSIPLSLVFFLCVSLHVFFSFSLPSFLSSLVTCSLPPFPPPLCLFLPLVFPLTVSHCPVSTSCSSVSVFLSIPVYLCLSSSLFLISPFPSLFLP